MQPTYNAKEYWEERLGRTFSLKGVGHQCYGEAYNRWLYRRKRSCLNRCFQGVSLKGKDVLDLGCGTGFFVEWYLSQGARITGMDITKVSVEQLKQRFPQGEFHTQDITDSTYSPPRLFDIVNIWDVVYHIVDPDKFDRAFYNISRSLKPGGLLLTTDHFGAPRDFQPAEHVVFRNLESHRRVLEPKGLKLVQIYPLYKWLNNNHLRKLDNFIGWLYFFLDERFKTIPEDNISMSLWRMGKSA